MRDVTAEDVEGVRRAVGRWAWAHRIPTTWHDDLISAGLEGAVGAAFRWDPEGGQSWDGWRDRRAVGAAIDWLRLHGRYGRLRRRHPQTFDRFPAGSAPAWPGRNGDVASNVASKDWVRWALGLLDGYHRQIVERTVIGGETLAAVGADLGIHESTVSLHRKRALEALSDVA